MTYIERDLEKLIKELAKEYACLLIAGPRQVGKSTMLEHLDGKRKRVSLDDLQERHLAKTDPEMFLKLHSAPLLIDEVQYAPELFSYLKIAIDKGAMPGSYFLTGSQSYALMSLAQESLAGRVALLNLTSLSQNELEGGNDNEPFKIDASKLTIRAKNRKPMGVNKIYQRIFEGGLPALVSGKFTNRDVYYSSYLATYLLRDVKEEIDIKDDFKFLDFLRSLACRVGSVLNIHALAIDVEISDDTAKRWLYMLEKSQIIFYLHPYSNNLLKRVIKSPKLYFFDTGLVAYLTKHSSPEILLSGALNGAILENYVVAEIRKSYLNKGLEPSIYYYRDKEQNEIDLILEVDDVLYPLEIKKTSNPSLEMIKSFALLEKSSLKIGEGAIICMKDSLSALNKNTLIIPVWYL